MAKSLSQLGDLSGYIDRDPPSNINNTAILAVGPHVIKCSGVILAARSAVLKEALELDNEIYLTEFVDVIDGVYDCLKLLYGGTVTVTADNAKVIYKFGTLYAITEMQKIVCEWVRDDLTQGQFWAAFFQFQRYHETTLGMFSECVRRLMGVDKTQFITFIESVLETCADTRDCKDILRLLKLCTASFSETVSVLFNTLNKSISVSIPTKETCAEELLSGLESEFSENSENVINLENVGDILECLEDILDNNMACIKRLAVLQRKLFCHVKQSATSEVAGPSGIQHVTPTNWLNKDSIVSLTNKGVPVDNVIKFVDDKSVAPYHIVEIVMKWVRNNKFTSETLHRLLDTSIRQLPEEYYKQCILYHDNVYPKIRGQKFQHDNKKYSVCGWKILGSSIRQLFVGARVPLSRCSLHNGVHSATFKYNTDNTPTYDLTERNLYGGTEVVGEIVHWYVRYRYKNNSYTVSFITNEDERGNSLEVVMNMNLEEVFLYCLYKRV